MIFSKEVRQTDYRFARTQPRGWQQIPFERDEDQKAASTIALFWTVLAIILCVLAALAAHGG